MRASSGVGVVLIGFGLLLMGVDAPTGTYVIGVLMGVGLTVAWTGH